MMQYEEENVNEHCTSVMQNEQHYFVEPHEIIPKLTLYSALEPWQNVHNLFRQYCITKMPPFTVSEEVTVESNLLYKAHFQQEADRRGLEIPRCLMLGLSPSDNMKRLITLADYFRKSPQRRWVYEQASRIELESLNFHNFHALLNGLFNEDGVTWERVLVLFFFCSDLTFRAVRRKFGRFFFYIYECSLCYISLILSHWIEQQGGWDVVLAHTMRNTSYKTGLVTATISCLGIIALFAFIRSSKIIE